VSEVDGELEVALRLSHDILGAAEAGDMFVLGQLDGQRRELIESFRRRVRSVRPVDQQAINEIAGLVDRSIGTIEHLRRVKAREVELVAVGRRAVNAYASTSSR
jgi:hypothetical protein